MTHITIPDDEPTVTYLASSSVGPHAVPFPVMETAAIHVSVGGVEIAPSAFTFTGLLPVVGGYQTGEITLAVAPTAQDVTIWRDTPLARSGDFATGPLSMPDLNTALDRLTAQIQDTRLFATNLPLVGITVPISSNLISFRAYGADSASRTAQDKLRELVTVEDFGASESATGAVNSAAFALLGAAHPGALVDLRDKSYTVTSLPTSFVPMHGHLKVGSTWYDAGPLRNSFVGTDSMVVDWGIVDQVAAGALAYVDTGDYFVVGFGRSRMHNPQKRSMTFMGVMFDGVTIDRLQTVYSSASYQLCGLCGGAMGSNVGMLGVEYDGVSYGDFKFIYHTDWDASAVTPTIVTISGLSFFPHYGPCPTENAGEYIFTGHTTGAAMYLKTTNYGAAASWSGGTLKAATGPFPNPAETTMQRIAANCYLLSARDDTAPPTYGDIRFAAGTTPTNFPSAWVASGIPLGAQPHTTKLRGGRYEVYCWARRGAPLMGYEDCCLVFSYDAVALYAAIVAGAAPAVPAPRIVARLPQSSVGYGPICTYRGLKEMMLFEAAESPDGSGNPGSSQMIRVGGDPSPFPAPSIIRQRGANDLPTTDNSFFDYDNRNAGTAVSAITASTKAVDRWRVARSTVACSAQQADLDNAYSEVYPWNPEKALRIQGLVGGSGVTVEQRYYGEAEIVARAGKTETLHVGMHGTIPQDYFRFRWLINYDSVTTNAEIYEDAAQRMVAGDGNMFAITAPSPRITAGATFGANCYITKQLIINGSGVIDAYLAGLYTVLGDQAIWQPARDKSREKDNVERWVERHTKAAGDAYGTSHSLVAGYAYLFHRWRIEKAATPVVTPPVLAQIEMFNGSGVSPTSQSGAARRDGYLWKLDNAAIVANNDFLVRSLSGGAGSFMLADAEPV